MRTQETTGSRKYQIYVGNLRAIDLCLNRLYGPNERTVIEAVGKHVLGSSRCTVAIEGASVENLRQRLTRSWTLEINSRSALEAPDYHAAELSVPECWRRLSYSIESLANLCLVLMKRTRGFPKTHSSTLRLLATLAKERPHSILPAPWSYWIDSSEKKCCTALEGVERLTPRKNLLVPMPENYMEYWSRMLRHPKRDRGRTPTLTIFNYICALRLRVDYPDGDIDFFIDRARDRNWIDFHEFNRKPILRLFGSSVAIFEAILLKRFGPDVFRNLLLEYKSSNVAISERERFENSVEARINMLIKTLDAFKGQHVAIPKHAFA